MRADVAHGFDGRSRGFGSVLFGTPEEARIAIGEFSTCSACCNPRFRELATGADTLLHFDVWQTLLTTMTTMDAFFVFTMTGSRL